MKNEYLILWREPVFYQSKVKAESKDEAIKLFYKLKESAAFINDSTDFGDIQIDSIDFIKKEETK